MLENFLKVGFYAIIIFFVILLIAKKFLQGQFTKLTKSMKGKVIIITGCNTGIGLATATELLKNEAKVIFACRDETRTYAAINKLPEEQKKNAVFIKLDLSNFSSIVSFVEQFKKTFNGLDILINNAGGVFDVFTLKENIENTIMTNYIGHVVLAALLINEFHSEGKIINLSSDAHLQVSQKQLDLFFTDLDFSAAKLNYSLWTRYCLSKIGNVFHAIHLTEYFNKKKLNIKAASLHPGLVFSDFLSRMETKILKSIMALTSPLQRFISRDILTGAQTTLHLAYIDHRELNSGAYYDNCKVAKAQKLVTTENTKKYMEVTKQLIQNSFKTIPNELKEYLDSI